MFDRKKMKEVCSKIANDTKQDAINFDGQPFNGKTVAKYFGYQGAAIATLADMVNSLVDELEEIQPTVT